MDELQNRSGFTKREKIIIALAALVLLAIFWATGFWLWKKFKPPREEKKISITNLVDQPKEKANNQPPQEATGESTAIREVPEENKISPEEIDIKVLNGGSLAGAAASVKGLLAGRGYAKTEAGNAKLSSYKGVAIYYKADFKDQVQEIKNILAGKYKTVETKEGISSGEASGDIVIILGK